MTGKVAESGRWIGQVGFLPFVGLTGDDLA
jgi:hypothetical protein